MGKGQGSRAEGSISLPLQKGPDRIQAPASSAQGSGQEGQQALSLAGPQTGAAAHGESAPPQPTRTTGVRSVEAGEGSGREGSDTIRKPAKGQRRKRGIVEPPAAAAKTRTPGEEELPRPGP